MNPNEDHIFSSEIACLANIIFKDYDVDFKEILLDILIFDYVNRNHEKLNDKKYKEAIYYYVKFHKINYLILEILSIVLEINFVIWKPNDSNNDYELFKLGEIDKDKYINLV